MQSIQIEVDDSDLKRKLQLMKNFMKPETFNRAMFGIFRDTGRHVKAILGKDIPKQYAVTSTKVKKAVKSPQVTSGGLNTGCIIPIRDKRGVIGSQYTAKGSAKGWQSLHKKYRVKAKVLKSGDSTLPVEVYTGYKPFRNIPSKLNKVAYARTSKERGPIIKLTGISIPQMPINRSYDDVQKDIEQYVAGRIEKRFQYMISTMR